VDGESGSRFLVFDGAMNVICGALREVRPTLEKRVLAEPHGML